MAKKLSFECFPSHNFFSKVIFLREKRHGRTKVSNANSGTERTKYLFQMERKKLLNIQRAHFNYTMSEKATTQDETMGESSNEEDVTFNIKYSTVWTKQQTKTLNDLKISREWTETVLGPIIHSTSSISIRLMDWLCCNYAKSRGVSIQYEDDTSKRMFCIHDEYEQKLNGLGRKLFDPFRRGSRVFLEVTKGGHTEIYETTLGQLTFWKWADTHGVLQYALDNAEDIEKDMNSAHHKREIEKLNSKGKKRRRTALSQRPEQKCVFFQSESGGTATIDFGDDPDFF